MTQAATPISLVHGTVHDTSVAADLFAKAQTSTAPDLAAKPEASAETLAIDATQNVDQKIEPEAEKKPDPLSPKFAELARQERRLQMERAKFKEESKGLNDYLAAKKNARLNPLEYVKASGLDPTEFYENLTKFILDGKVPENAQVRELETKLEQFQREAKEKEEAAQKAETARQQQAARAQVRETVIKAGEKFELVNQYDQHDMVCDVIVKQYEATGEDLTIEQAAERVEKYLEEQAEKYIQTKRYQTKYPKALETKPGLSLVAPEAHQTKTLTNSASNGTTAPRPEMTDDEKMQWAIKMLSNK
jgi:hypothetical protein